MIITNTWVKFKKTLQINISVNGMYDIKLCGSNTDYLLQCWSEVFFTFT